MWAGFRVGRRARPVGLDLQLATLPWRVACAHDGYRFLEGRPLHHREWVLSADALTVHDRVDPVQADAVARYLLAPGLRLIDAPGGHWQLLGPQGPLATVEVLRGRAALAPAHCTTRFGVIQETLSLLVHLADGQAVTRWRWHEPHAHPLPDR